MNGLAFNCSKELMMDNLWISIYGLAKVAYAIIGVLNLGKPRSVLEEAQNRGTMVLEFPL
jgi:hypothetical protein